MELKNDTVKVEDNTSNEQDDDIETSIDPYVEFDIKKNYINMSDVEREKLAWMKNIPKIQLNEVCVSDKHLKMTKCFLSFLFQF